MSEFKSPVKLVYVEWVDSSTSRGWLDPERDETSVIRSAGILVSRTDRTITLSTSESQHGRVIDQINIPMSCVRRVRRIRA